MIVFAFTIIFIAHTHIYFVKEKGIGHFLIENKGKEINIGISKAYGNYVVHNDCFNLAC